MWKSELCKGCGEDTPVSPCDFSYTNKVGMECPCGICLVKGICKTVCKDFKEFRIGAKL